MKRGWQKLSTGHKRETKGRAIDKITFPKMIKQLVESTAKKTHFQSAFKAAGPYHRPDAATIPQSKITPSEPVTKPHLKALALEQRLLLQQ
jgi:hypothetical protein